MKMKALLIATLLTLSTTHAFANHATSAADAFKEVNDQMMNDMMAPMSGSADKDFVMMMMPHHQGAIDMANIELKHGKDKKLRTMAHTIIDAQKKEIEEMKKWMAANP